MILLKMAVVLINLLGLFLFIGIPVFIAIAMLGIDLAQVKYLLPELVENPSSILSKYIGLVMLVFISFILYLTVVSVLILYIFGGTLGVLRNAALNMQYKFSFSSFFEEAKKLFFPLLWLFSIALLFVSAFVFIFGIFTAVVIYVLLAYRDSGTAFSVFITYFLGLLIIFFSVIGTLACLIFTVYASLALAVKEKGVIDSFKNAWNFVKNKPFAFLFYIILVIGVTAANLLLVILGASLSAVPLTGLILGIPYRILSFVVQSYLGVLMWASLLIYYIKNISPPAYGDTSLSYDI